MSAQFNLPATNSPRPQPPVSTSGAAITGMVFGILSLITIPGFLPFSITAVIFSHLALKRIKASPLLTGRGMAISGLVMGYLSTLIGLIVVAFFVYIARLDPDSSLDDWLESSPVEEGEFVEPEDAEVYIIIPQGHSASDPIPGAIWLHGYGWNPSEISIFEEEYQERANELGIAFIAISATQKIDEGSYQWTEDLETDSEYIQSVLAEHEGKVRLRWPDVALFGFSQGAKVAGDVALADPSRYAGAILFSPGGFLTRPEIPETALPGHAGQHFFCFVGADEAYGNVRLNQKYHDAFLEMGASSIHKEYPGMEEHTTPPDFDEKLEEWLKTILGLKEIPK